MRPAPEYHPEDEINFPDKVKNRPENMGDFGFLYK